MATGTTQLNIIINATGDALAKIATIREQMQGLATGISSPFTKAADQAKASARNLTAEWTKNLAAIRTASGYTQEVLIKHGESILKAMALRKGANAERINELRAVLTQFSRGIGIEAGQASLQMEAESRKRGLMQIKAQAEMEKDLQGAYISRLKARREMEDDLRKRGLMQIKAQDQMESEGRKAHMTQLKARAMMEKDLQSGVSTFLQRTGSMMRSQISWFAGAGTIFAVVGAIRAASKATLEFYQNLKNIQAIDTEATAADIRNIAAAAIEVAKTTPIAASEATKMGLKLIQAGLDSKEAAEAMKTVSAVTTISGEDMQQVSMAVTTAMKAWHIPAEEIPKIGNAIAGALNYSRLTVADLGTAFNYLASVSSIMNRGLVETVSNLAVMSNMGVKASTSGTGLSQLMTQLLVPTAKLSAELKKMNISANDINPTFHKMSEIVKKLKDEGFSTTKAMNILDVRAGRALATLMAAGPDALTAMEEKISKQSNLQKQLDIAMEGPINKMAQLRNQIEVTAIQIGAVGVPAFTMLIDLFKVFGQTAVAATSGFSTLTDILTPTGTRLGIIAVGLAALAWHFRTVAVAAIAAGTATTMFGAALGLLSKHPYLVAITATIAGFTFLGTLFRKNRDEAEALAKAKNELVSVSEKIKKNNDILIASEQDVERHITSIKEAWESAGKVMATVKLPGEDKLFKAALDINVYKGEITKLTDEIKKLQEGIDDVNKAATQGFFGKWWADFKSGLKEIPVALGEIREQIKKDLQDPDIQFRLGSWAPKAEMKPALSPAQQAAVGLANLEIEKKRAQILQLEADIKRVMSNINAMYVDPKKFAQDFLAGIKSAKDLSQEEKEKRFSSWVEAQVKILNAMADGDQKMLARMAFFEGAQKVAAELGIKDKAITQAKDYTSELADAAREVERLAKELEDMQAQDPLAKMISSATKAQNDLWKQIDDNKEAMEELAKGTKEGWQGAIIDLALLNNSLWQQLHLKGKISDPAIAVKSLELAKKKNDQEVSASLARIALLEQEQKISPLSAIEQRIDLEQSHLQYMISEQRKINQGIEDGAALWREQEEDIEKTRNTLRELAKQQQEWTGSAMEGFKSGVLKYIQDPALTAFKQMEGLATDTAQAMSSSFSTFFSDAFANDLKKGAEYFNDFLTSILNSMSKMLADKTTQAFLQAFASSMGWTTPATTPPGTFTGPISGDTYAINPPEVNAKGNVFGGAGISAYSNRIVSQPTIFPFARGIGLMGESGQEAIIPLKRTKSGNLGVESTPANISVPVSVNITNQTGQQVTAEASAPSFDGEQWVVNVVMKAMNNNPSVRSGMRSAVQGY